MTRPEIEPQSPRPLANTLLIRPMAQNYVGPSISFQIFLVQAFKIVIDS